MPQYKTCSLATNHTKKAQKRSLPLFLQYNTIKSKELLPVVKLKCKSTFLCESIKIQ